MEICNPCVIIMSNGNTAYLVISKYVIFELLSNGNTLEDLCMFLLVLGGKVEFDKVSSIGFAIVLECAVNSITCLVPKQFQSCVDASDASITTSRNFGRSPCTIQLLFQNHLM